ncbi:MAG: FtsX-like permease family protein [Erysipelothrix sp.]
MVKDILREIKAKWLQFVAILLITCLGVGFFVGIRVTGYDMRKTADLYMETHDVLNMEFRHTLGIDDVMIESLSNIVDGKAVGVNDTDSFVKSDSFDGVMKLIEYTKLTSQDITLIEGELPKQSHELVADHILKDQRGLKPGDTVEIKDNDVFEPESYKVVGFVESSRYMNLERGNSQIGSGNILGFLYINEPTAKHDIYTSARFYLNEGADVDAEIKKVKAQEDVLTQARYERAIAPELEKLKDAEAELKTARDEAEIQFADARKQLDDGKAKLDGLYTTIDDGIYKMAQGLDMELAAGSFEKQIGDVLRVSQEKQKTVQTELDKQRSDLIKKQTGVEAGLAQIKVQKDDLLVKYEVLEQKIESTDPTSPEYPQLVAQFEMVKAGLAEIEKNEQPLLEAQKEIENGLTQIDAKQTEIDTLFGEIRTNSAVLLDVSKKYDEGLATYNQQEATYQTEHTHTFSKIDEAQQIIDDGYKEIEENRTGKAFVLGREDVLIGYREFYDDSDRIEAIGQVFPLIFFGVAILVTLSTVSRMVDESRMQIGVYKALGYSWFKTSLKFVGFAFIAWFLGSILGIALGFYFIPTLIYDAYRIMYLTPELETGIILSYAWLPLLVSFLSSVGIAMGRSMKVSRETTANLLRPPLPKSGQRIFLERITFLWERMSFLYKVSMRNLFRNKTRFLMTVIGIGGCCGLLITGFGLRHSIYSIIDKHFDQVINYDGMITYNGSVDLSKVELDGSIEIMSEGITVGTRDAQMFVADDLKNLNQFINFKDRKSHDDIVVDNSGVIISEKLAILEDLNVGDMFTFEILDREYQVPITGIVENYVMHYAYMSDDTYQRVTGNEVKDNVILFQTDAASDSFKTTLLEQSDVFSVSFLKEMRDSYQDAMGNFDIVIYVVVGAAFALELIVLLNLISMNLSERQKELATLKVLGFYPKELAQYILRENIVLTVLSLFFGVFFGYYLHKFVILQAEIDAVMFNRELLWTSVGASIALTFIISIIINLLMARRTNHVNMSEALKTFDD